MTDTQVELQTVRNIRVFVPGPVVDDVFTRLGMIGALIQTARTNLHGVSDAELPENIRERLADAELALEEALRPINRAGRQAIARQAHEAQMHALTETTGREAIREPCSDG